MGALEAHGRNPQELAGKKEGEGFVTFEELAEPFVNRIKQVQGYRDAEAAHGEADKALCDLLIELGYGFVVEEWRKVRKWYA